MKDNIKEIISVVGTRPNFMKIAPLCNEIDKRDTLRLSHYLVHTGQHYDSKMSESFFQQLGIPEPDINLEVKEFTHATQTARIMERFETVCLERKPDLVVVVGDVNSTLACALTAVKLGIKVAHIEAGLRSFDRAMPEELNRLLTDAISDYLFVTEPQGVKNLKHEGVAEEKIFYVGNIMIDTLLNNHFQIAKSPIRRTLGFDNKKYAVLTLHRPSNVDKKENLLTLFRELRKISALLPIIFPVHPRTVERLKEFGIDSDFLTIVPPMGYIDFIKLVDESQLVLSDSGGIQAETSFMGVHCLTLRKNTESPITIEQGTNQLVGAELHRLERICKDLLKGTKPSKPNIKYWDGKTAARIVNILLEQLNRV